MQVFCSLSRSTVRMGRPEKQMKWLVAKPNEHAVARRCSSPPPGHVFILAGRVHASCVVWYMKEREGCVATLADAGSTGDYHGRLV